MGYQYQIGGGPNPSTPTDLGGRSDSASSLFTMHIAVHFVVAVLGTASEWD